jgi:hypothetical protein
MKLIVGHGVHFGHYGPAILLTPKPRPKQSDLCEVTKITHKYTKSKSKPHTARL